MDKESCEKCRFWDERAADGFCRRNPPIIDPKEDLETVGTPDYFTGMWPMTLSDDWCGEWQGKVPEVCD